MRWTLEGVTMFCNFVIVRIVNYQPAWWFLKVIYVHAPFLKRTSSTGDENELFSGMLSLIWRSITKVWKKMHLLFVSLRCYDFIDTVKMVGLVRIYELCYFFPQKAHKTPNFLVKSEFFCQLRVYAQGKELISTYLASSSSSAFIRAFSQPG